MSARPEEGRRRYETDGVAFPIPVLTPAETGRYRAACDELEARMGGKPRTVEVRQMHLHFRWAYEIATHPRVLDAVERVLGPDLLIWATELFAKHPHDETVSINWHRDRPYIGFTAGRTATAWIALADSTAANGCMRVLPRSAERAAAVSANGSGSKTAETAVAPEDCFVDVILRAGEMSLHDADVLHGSGPNRSAEKRVGFVVRYLTPEARPVSGRPRVVLARGRHEDRYCDLVDPPAPDDAERALAGMRESAARHLDALLDNLRFAGAATNSKERR
jgi:hypothetical protein